VASDRNEIKKFGFTLSAKKSNPPIKDRISSANKLFECEILLVNEDMCPETVAGLSTGGEGIV